MNERKATPFRAMDHATRTIVQHNGRALALIVFLSVPLERSRWQLLSHKASVSIGSTADPPLDTHSLCCPIWDILPHHRQTWRANWCDQAIRTTHTEGYRPSPPLGHSQLGELIHVAQHRPEPFRTLLWDTAWLIALPTQWITFIHTRTNFICDYSEEPLKKSPIESGQLSIYLFLH